MPDRPAKPVYVLHGSDQFLRRRRRGDIIGALLGDTDPQLARVDLDDDAELADVLDALRTPTFLAPRRVVVMDDADAFITRHRKALEKYFTDPAPTGSLILTVDNWQSGWNLAKIVADVGELVHCSPPPPGKLPKWMANVARTHGKKLSAAAAKQLIEGIGNDLARLRSEIEKLSLFVGERAEITDGDVGAVVAASAGPVDYALSNALSARNAREALKALDDLLTRRGEEFRVLGTLRWHLGSPRNRARYSDRDFRRLLAADLGMKTGAEPKAALQLLVTQLCR